jgi:hypothetical protein
MSEARRRHGELEGPGHLDHRHVRHARRREDLQRAVAQPVRDRGVPPRHEDGDAEGAAVEVAGDRTRHGKERPEEGRSLHGRARPAVV